MVMGKASERRKRKRQEYLKQLSINNPKKFRYEWSKRCESWAEDIRSKANQLTDKNGNPTPTTFMIAENVLSELAKCGEKAFKMEARTTAEVMLDSC
jgi:hypothetical protein